MIIADDFGIMTITSDSQLRHYRNELCKYNRRNGTKYSLKRTEPGRYMIRSREFTPQRGLSVWKYGRKITEGEYNAIKSAFQGVLNDLKTRVA